MFHLVWHDRGNGQCDAPAASFRKGRRWIEVGGQYYINEYFDEHGRCFRVGYQPGEGRSIHNIAITRSLGNARVQAATHYFDLCEAAAVIAA